MDSLDGYVSDDEHAIGPLNDLGIDVQTISWRDKTADWDAFDIVVIRTTWDYQRDPDVFVDVLRRIESSPARLENPLDVVKWNLDKRYLRELAAGGVEIVPTIWDAVYSEAAFDKWLAKFDTGEVIVKPTVSATAEHTYRLSRYDPGLNGVFADRSFMVQPFMRNIVDEGEYSLFYFDGEYSHTILKQPEPADFRVQEEHGGLITTAVPVAELIGAGERALRKIRPGPLYARVDLVRGDTDSFLLMELELIEPALYLRMDPASTRRFASAISRRIDRAME